MKNPICISKKHFRQWSMFVLLSVFLFQNCFAQVVADSKLRECLPTLKVAGGLKASEGKANNRRVEFIKL